MAKNVCRVLRATRHQLRSRRASGTMHGSWSGLELLGQLETLPIITDEKVRLALELFAESHYDTGRSRFIRLVTILEILADAPPRPDHVLKWMEPIVKTIRQIGKSDFAFTELATR